ncbi:TPA: hypothetical protein NGS02_004536 [Vibrio parahaemolyticus]|nr:hypothetical protein [Vibrio parahaemolyticus]HCE3215920.1 hypothetical protein [Vibrio parahaemolyticus]HCE4594911.1 hypothetical protein [Vibrio parahaemolyticus]HCG5929966.1 hypothetical protein [Vibrio parahaemolyticus]HCG9584277.1 hypothetical protein [Vibrio parahaemolyticus]
MTEAVQEVEKVGRRKRVWSVMSIIFLGSLGSGLWDLFLKDSLFFILQWVTNIADSIFVGFADSFYSDVGKASQPMLTVLVPIFMVVAVIAFTWFNTVMYFVQSSKDYTPSPNKSRKRVPFLSVFFPVMTCLITATYGHALVSDVYNFKVSNYVERSIEILRPGISESKYIELRAQYRQVETRDQFQELFNELINLEEQSNVVLPKFEPLMVQSNT